MTRHLIATGHWPPHGPLRIVMAGGYELAVLPGEDVRALVEAAEAVRTEDAMSKTQSPIMDFCYQIITGPGGLDEFQRHEWAVENEPHDVCVAAWVVRCLASPACENSQMVLDAILERRKKVLADQRAAELSKFYYERQP